jgi:hypothetical protein
MDVGKFLEMMGKRCPGDGNFRPQIAAGNFALYSSDPFENFKSPVVDQRSSYPQ